jgi:hypothetical protein
MKMGMTKVSLMGLAVIGIVSAASAQSWDRHRDRADIRADVRDLHHAEAVKYRALDHGNYRLAREEQRRINEDRRDIRMDRRDLHHDRW